MRILLKKKLDPKITLDKSITPCQIRLTYFFLSLNDDDYILTIPIVLKNEKKSSTISFCARPD